MGKFDFIGNGEIREDRPTMTVRSITMLSSLSGGRVHFRSKDGKHLKIDRLDRADGIFILKLAETSHRSIETWGTGKPNPSVMDMPIIATIPGSGEMLTISMEDGDGDVLVSADEASS